MISISNRCSVFVLFFFPPVFRRWLNGSWVTMNAPKHCNMSQQLIGVLTLIFSAEEVYYPYSFAPIYSSFHHCFCSERCYFCTFGGGSVARRAITVAVAESYDLTLWREIIANIIHSAVVTVKRASWGHISQEGEGSRETALMLSTVRNADAEHISAASGALIFRSRKGLLLSCKIRQWHFLNQKWKKKLFPFAVASVLLWRCRCNQVTGSNKHRSALCFRVTTHKVIY